jgi:L,D-peptidoglycan transpeptidase YkuD (ErfK/YbiS/YcfS/YnhG family)
MDLHVSVTAPPHGGALRCGERVFACAVGRGGIREAKREGDGATPAGCFAIREILYRADRVQKPESRINTRALVPDDGWCDDPADAAYNRLVRLPYPARAENLWREDGQYDVIAVLGYNDAPVEPGRGSAIFLHVAKPGMGATEGCVALELEDLLTVLKLAGADARLCAAAD